MQETLIEAWKSLTRLNNSCRLETWLYAILLHRHRKALRHARVRPFFVSTRNPGIVPSYQRSARLEAESAMLVTAIQISEQGLSSIVQSIDPFGDGAPFEVEEIAIGIQLKSRLILDGKPVTLNFVGFPKEKSD